MAIERPWKCNIPIPKRRGSGYVGSSYGIHRRHQNHWVVRLSTNIATNSSAR